MVACLFTYFFGAVKRLFPLLRGDRPLLRPPRPSGCANEGDAAKDVIEERLFEEQG